MTPEMSHHWSLRAVHWAVAALLVLLIPSGLFIEGFDAGRVRAVDDLFGAGAFNVLYDLHKSLGLTVLGLMVLRVAVRATRPAPPYVPPLPAWRRRASGAVHVALYALLFAAPVVGWIGVSLYPAPATFWFVADLRLPLAADREASGFLLGDVHGPLAIMIAILAAVHVLAALKHRYVDRDYVFQRMTR